MGWSEGVWCVVGLVVNNNTGSSLFLRVCCVGYILLYMHARLCVVRTIIPYTRIREMKYSSTAVSQDPAERKPYLVAYIRRV